MNNKNVYSQKPHILRKSHNKMITVNTHDPPSPSNTHKPEVHVAQPEGVIEARRDVRVTCVGAGGALELLW